MLETAIFKPYNRSLDEEQWPQLELGNVVVYKHVADGPDEICDLLDIHFTKPLRITGTLSQIPAKYGKIVIDNPVIGERSNSIKTAAALAKSLYGVTITIPNVHTYALESYKNQRTNSTIWALGGAAWYAISPAPEYCEHFNRSLEKAHAWDLVMALAESEGFKDVTVKQVFAKYFRKHPSCNSVNGAETKFREFRTFLVAKMLENIDRTPGAKRISTRAKWRNFCLWKWLTAEYTGIVEEVQKSIKAGKIVGNPSTNKLAFSLDTQYGFDSLESFTLERKPEPSQLTIQWLISFVTKKSGSDAQDVQLLLQGQANALSTLMARSRQVDWVQSSLYSDLLLMSGEAPPDGNNDEGTGGGPALRVKKNSGSGKGKAETTANLNPAEGCSGDAPDGINDMEQDNDHFSSPHASPQPPRSAKGKSVLRPIMTPSVQQKSGEESGVSSPPSSPPPSPLSTPVTVEKLVAPGPSTLHKRKLGGSATNPEEPTKRGRVAEGSSSEGADSGDGGNAGKEWPPLIPGQGRPPIRIIPLPRTDPDDGGTFWRCYLPRCLTIIPEADTWAGRSAVQEHLNEHYKALIRAGLSIDEFPRADRSVDALLAKIESMAEDWQHAQEENLKGFDELNRSLIELDRQRERERALAEEEAKQKLEEQAKESNNGKGKAKGKRGAKGKGKQ